MTGSSPPGSVGSPTSGGHEVAPRSRRAQAGVPAARGPTFVEQGDAAAPAGASRDPRPAGTVPAPRSLRTSRPRRWPTRARRRPSGATRRCSVAVERVESELRRTAEDGDLVLAVTDADTRILWTYGGRVMRRKAETVELRGRWTLGRRVGRHQRPRPRQPARRAIDGLQRRALRLDRAQLGLLGRAGRRPDQRPPARRHRPLHHMGPQPPDRPGHRAGDGAADRDRAARTRTTTPPARSLGRHRRPRPRDDPPRHRRGAPRRAAAAAQPASDRGAGPAGPAPRGALARAAARAASTATRPSRSPRSRPRSRTCARRSVVSSPRGRTDC